MRPDGSPDEPLLRRSKALALLEEIPSLSELAIHASTSGTMPLNWIHI
jgi:hypothetical protein